MNTQDLGAGEVREREAVRTARDPEVRRKNRKLGLILVAICILMATCGFAYVRWLMTRLAGPPH